jgi:hypothetical protein
MLRSARSAPTEGWNNVSPTKARTEQAAELFLRLTLDTPGGRQATRLGLRILGRFCEALEKGQKDGRLGLSHNCLAATEGLSDTTSIKRALKSLRDLHLLIRTNHHRSPVDGQWDLDLYALGDGYPPGLIARRYPTYEEVMGDLRLAFEPRACDNARRAENYKSAAIAGILADVGAIDSCGEQMNIAGYLFGTHAEQFNMSKEEALRITLERVAIPAHKAASLARKFHSGFKAGLANPKRMPPPRNLRP